MIILPRNKSSRHNCRFFAQRKIRSSRIRQIGCRRKCNPLLYRADFAGNHAGFEIGTPIASVEI
jgi:hypothetical protein